MKMKKNYIKPQIKVSTIEPSSLMAASGVTGDGVDIYYGGSDDDGSITPSAKINLINWDWTTEE